MTLAALKAERIRADERMGYRRRRADGRHFSLPWLKSHPGRVFSGGDTVTLEHERVKYIRHNSPYWPFGPGELARAYMRRQLKEQLPGWPRLTTHYTLSDRDKALLAIPAPLYFDPKRGREGYFVYVDIGACYFDLFAPWPLNASFNVETGAVGRPSPELVIPAADLAWLRREKPIRHAMFGMMQSQGISWYANGKHEHRELCDDFTAPDIVALVHLSCHAIARAAVQEFGCRMWLTDAGIFTEREALLFQLWLADKWRLDSKPKHHGKGHLWAMGDYRIGRYRTGGQHVDLPGWHNLAGLAGSVYPLVEAPESLAERRRERLEGLAS